MSLQREITIVGGGIVGMIMALALVKGAHKVSLIEKQLINNKTDKRSIALSYSSLCVLNTLGLWEVVAPYVTPIKHIHVSDKGAYGQVCLHAQDENLPFFGAIVPMSALLEACHQTLLDYGEAFRWMEAEVVGVKEHQGAYALSVNIDGHCKTMASDLIIAADGANSFIRQALAMQASVYDYHQSAIVCDISLRRPHQNWAYERFINNGVMAMLPLGGQKCACIWTINHDLVEELLNLSNADLVKKIQRVFGYRLGQFLSVTTPSAFPLSLMQASKLYKSNVLLFGNASHFLHPISGQGLNLSIRDIGVLYDLSLSDKSTEQILKAYEHLRQDDHRRTAKVTHGLIESFSRKELIWQKARSLGLHLLHRDDFAKSFFSQLMMGKFTQGSSLNARRIL